MDKHSDEYRAIRCREFLKWAGPSALYLALIALVLAFKRWQPERAAQLRQWLWGPDEADEEQPCKDNSARIVAFMALMIALGGMMMNPL